MSLRQTQERQPQASGAAAAGSRRQQLLAAPRLAFLINSHVVNLQFVWEETVIYPFLASPVTSDCEIENEVKGLIEGPNRRIIKSMTLVAGITCASMTLVAGITCASMALVAGITGVSMALVYEGEDVSFIYIYFVSVGVPLQDVSVEVFMCTLNFNAPVFMCVNYMVVGLCVCRSPNDFGLISNTLHDVYLPALWPSAVFVSGRQHPNCRPCTNPRRNLCPNFESSVKPVALTLCC